jgi:hypothetical protein
VDKITASDDGNDCVSEDNAIGIPEALKASFSLISTGADL